MIIKGTPAAGGQRLADHVSRTDTNERVELKEIRGAAADNLRDALLELEAVGSGSRTKRPFYHASINTQADEKLTDAQRMQSIDRLEKELGLEGQPRVVVVHEKKDREHCHVVWLRVEIDSMTAIRADHNFRKHEIVAREMERAFGHERIQGAHIERDGGPRPPRTPSHAEMQQAERTGISPKDAKAHITGIWQRTDSGAAFQSALEQSGWLLARGDRRDYVAIDPRGGVHSLARRVDGATVKDVRARLVDIDLQKLPSVAEGKALQSERAPPAAAHVKQASKSAAKKVDRAPSPGPSRQPIRIIGDVAARGPRPSIGRPVRGAAKIGGKLLGGIAGGFERLLGGGPSRPAPRADGQTQDDNRRPLDRGKTPAREVIEKVVQQDAEQKSAHRQRLLRDYSREVSPETEKDLQIERDNKGRERKRGE